LLVFPSGGQTVQEIHDLFDLERHPDETDESAVVTTWHADEPLSEAVCYFDLCACPSSDFERDCNDWVAISVGEKHWEEEMCAALIDGFDGDN
jgi:hypothetical protein